MSHALRSFVPRGDDLEEMPADVGRMKEQDGSFFAVLRAAPRG